MFFLQKVSYKKTNLAVDLTVKFIQYGTTSKDDKSGAYLFMPDGEAKDIELTDEKGIKTTPLLRFIRGPVVSELQVVMPQVIHIVRVYHGSGMDSQSIEIENRADITRKSNYELAMHLGTSINNQEFVTDLNGFQLIRRTTHSKLPLQANYYPMPTTAYIEDIDLRLTVVGKQPLGVASLQKGRKSQFYLK